MLKRIIVGVIGALVAITVIVFRNTPLLSIVLAFFTVLAAYEIEKCVQVKNKAVMAVSLVFSALMPFYYEYEPELSSRGITIPVTVVLAIYILLLFILMLTDYDHTKFEDVATVIIATTFVPWGFSTLIMLNDVDRTFPDEFDGHHGLFFILFGLFCAWLSDTFAYFTGRFLGKHKLCPKISPKKTVEGAVGGVVGAVLSCVILFAIFDKFFFTVHSVTYLEVIILSAVLSVIGMCGDLTASVMKRNFGVKDFGKLFPGHGGVMDRFDSALFVLTALYASILITRNVF
jgi:phosphatidate cytidylyltransferase